MTAPRAARPRPAQRPPRWCSGRALASPGSERSSRALCPWRRVYANCRNTTRNAASVKSGDPRARSRGPPRTGKGRPTCSQLGRPNDGAFCDSVALAPRRRRMKAIVSAQTGGPEVLAQADVPKPDVRPGGVLIKNHAIGVNFADTRFRQGTYTVKPKLPDSPGMEVAGVIEAVGDGVTNLRPGMRVAAFTSRAYAEYCVSPAFMVIPLPDSVSFVDGAAFLIQVLTAYHLLHTADSTGPGRSVLVHSAAGGVGLAAVQLAKVAGARVFGTVSSDAKAGLVTENGADTVINYAREKFADEVLRLTSDRGVDLILDAVGKPTFEEGLRCLAPFGHLVLYGRAGGAPDALNVSVLSPKSQKVSAFSLPRSEEHTSELQSLAYLVCRLLLEKKKIKSTRY